MACPHNQAQIDAKQAQIDAKRGEISTLNGNIDKTEQMKANYEAYNAKIECVINNLDGNSTQAGVPFDNGTMTECNNTAEAIISDCDTIIQESTNKISVLEAEIGVLSAEISGLQGDCAACAEAKRRAAEEEQRRYYSGK